MAKKKSRKGALGIVLALVVLGLAIVTACTLFMPIFTTKSTLVGVSSTSHIKGIDALVAVFKGEASTDLSDGANALILLKNADESGAVTTIFCWAYFLTVVVSVAIIVFALLKIFGFKFKLVNAILGLVVVVLALTTFICGFIVASKFASVSLGSLASGKTVASVANYLMLLAMCCGCTNIYLARLK